MAKRRQVLATTNGSDGTFRVALYSDRITAEDRKRHEQEAAIKEGLHRFLERYGLSPQALPQREFQNA